MTAEKKKVVTPVFAACQNKNSAEASHITWPAKLNEMVQYTQ